MKKLFQWMFAAILICGATVFTACSSDDDKNESNVGTPALAMIVKTGHIGYWQQIESAFRAACKEKGLQALYYCTTGENAYEEQIEAVKQLAQLKDKNIKGVIYAPSYGLNGECADTEVAAFAKERGIPVILLDSKATASSPLAACPFFGTDDAAAGKALAEKVTATKVAAFAVRNSPGVVRADAFKTVIAGTDIYTCGENANKEIYAVLDQYDDFVFMNGTPLPAALDMLKKAHKNIYTFDLYAEFIDELVNSSSKFKGIMAQNTFLMTQKAVDAALANAKEGEMVPTFYVTADNLDDDIVKPYLEYFDKTAGSKDRRAFVAHTRERLQAVAENLRFTTWNSFNYMNSILNQYILLNDDFDKTISRAFGQKIQETLKPFEMPEPPADRPEGNPERPDGPEGPDHPNHKYMATIDLTDFNFTFTATTTGFDMAENDDQGLVVVMPVYGTSEAEGVKVAIKGTGDTYSFISPRLSNDSVRVDVEIPAQYDLSLSVKANGKWTEYLYGTIKNTAQAKDNEGPKTPSGSTPFKPTADGWNVACDLHTNIPGVDATDFYFAIGQDPETHKAGLKFDYAHNGYKIVDATATLNNANGMTDLSQITSTTSIMDIFTAIMAGNSVEDMQFTLLDCLTTTGKISDCEKVVEIQNAMAHARRNYADQQTIAGYVDELNGLISCTMSDKTLGQEIPMRLATTKIGVDWWAVPALSFADENGFVPLTELLDQESLEYGLNIIDHASEPIQGSIIVARQLLQAIQKLQAAFYGSKPNARPE